MFNTLVSIQEITLILENIVLISRVDYVDEVIGNLFSIDGLVGKVFAGAQVHSPVDLP